MPSPLKLRLSDFFENHPLPSWICEPKTLIIIDANRAAIKSTGYSKAKLQRLTFQHLLKEPAKLSAGKSITADVVRKKGSQTVQLTVSNIVVGKKKMLLIVATPATDTSRNAEELRRSKEELSEAMRFTKFGTIELTLENHEMKLSEEFLHLLEENPGKADTLLFEHFVDRYVIPSDRSIVYEKLQEGLGPKGIKRVQTEIRIQTAKGNLKVFEVQGTFRMNGKVLGILHDITDKRNSKEDVANYSERSQKAEEEIQFMYRNLFEHNPLPMWIYDVKTYQFLDVNKTAVQLYGYSKEEFLAMTIMDIRGAEDRVRLKKTVENAGPHLRSTAGWKHTLKNGTVIDVEIYSQPIDFIDRPCRIVVANNITEKNKAERENEKLALIASRTSNAVIFTDSRGYITWVNEGFERVTEYKLAEVIGKKPGDFLQGPETNSATVTYMKASLKKSARFRTEILNYTKSGRKYWLDIEVMPVTDRDNNLQGYMAIESDITTLKTAMHEMFKSQSQLQTILDHAPMMVYMKDKRGRYLFYNQTFQNILPRKIKDGATARDLFGDSLAEISREKDNEVMETGATVEFGYEIGDNRFLEVKFPIRDPEGNIDAIGGMSLDVTEQSKMVQQLSESEARYRSIVDDQQDLLCRIIEGGVFTFVNKAFAKTFGVVAEDLIGKNFSSLLPEDERGPMLANCQGIFDGTILPDPVEQKLKGADGSIRWIEWFNIPVRNEQGKIYELQSIGHDITERKKLASEQARLDRIVRESYNEIYLFNSSTLYFEFANASALRNLGYSTDELKKVKFSDLFSYPDEMALKALLSPLLKGETPSVQLQIKHHRKNGTQYDVDTVIQFLEKERSLVAIATDITEKLKTEKKLLATIIEKETLIKEIHHRVKNNLQLISSIIYIKMKSLKEPEVKYFLENTRQKIRSIALIHERLLQSEKLDRVEISDYLGRLIYDLQVTNTTPDLTLDFRASIQESIMDLDSAIYCGLIVNELITNAIKHAFKGRTHGTIEVEFRKDNGKFFLEVKDNGTTIPEEITVNDSSSFGLHLLQIFVRQLGGTLEIIREKGTIFQMRF
jgi:PAS domain S-box-containing protein